MSKAKTQLTMRQAAFLNAYIKLGMKNATQAAIQAGYASKYADRMAYTLVEHPSIKPQIEKYREKIAQQIEVTFQDKVELLWSLAKQSQEDGSKDIVVKAIAEINKMMGHYAPEKSYHMNVNQNIEVKEVQDIRALYKKEI